MQIYFIFFLKGHYFLDIQYLLFPFMSYLAIISAEIFTLRWLSYNNEPVYPFKFLYDMYVSAHKSVRAQPR